MAKRYREKIEFKPIFPPPAPEEIKTAKISTSGQLPKNDGGGGFTFKPSAKSKVEYDEIKD